MNGGNVKRHLSEGDAMNYMAKANREIREARKEEE